ncbi:copper homeostasis protein CutC [Endozoicomonas sp. (ex Bugula neritina AB1)]|nr:copper homeostasis protein CutC [Endozoicomonas sp. (ex Bugula neritina AB1)]
MKRIVEVCIDNIESLPVAVSAGADRIELCSALALGGLTPTAGYVKKAVELSSVPIYSIIRHRGGDFVFNEDEIDLMVADIVLMKQLGASGVVVGALTAEGEVNTEALQRFMIAADGMGVTFHRAFDLVKNPVEALEIIIKHGCERILTSGQQAAAAEGTALIQTLVKQAGGRISIMPGAGINSNNVLHILQTTEAREFHLSGKTTRPGKMRASSDVFMGENAEDDRLVNITDFGKIRSVVETLSGC